MVLIVGLGNPGKKYERTRHNTGFRVVDAFLESVKVESFFCWKKNTRLVSLVCRLKNKHDLLLAKPLTFMNESGKAVQALVKDLFRLSKRDFHKIKNLWIIHDDIDLPLGKIRLSMGASAAGHKGVQSIIDALGTKEFARFRIGIGRPPLMISAEKYVLEKFSAEEERALKKVISRTVSVILTALEEGIDKKTQK